MMSNLPLFITVSTLTALTPGAGVLFTVSSALQSRTSELWQAPLGNCIGSTSIAALCVAGLGAAVAANPDLFALFECLSALMLIFLGVRSWRAPALNTAKLSETSDGKKKGAFANLTLAAALQATNPMLYIYVLSLLPQFIDPKESFAAQAAVLIAIFGAVLLIVHGSYSFLASKARRWISRPSVSIGFNRVCGVLFIALAVSVFVQAAKAAGF